MSLKKGFFWQWKENREKDDYESFIVNIKIKDDSYNRSTALFNGSIPKAHACPRPSSCLGGLDSHCSLGYVYTRQYTVVQLNSIIFSIINNNLNVAILFQIRLKSLLYSCSIYYYYYYYYYYYCYYYYYYHHHYHRRRRRYHHHQHHHPDLSRASRPARLLIQEPAQTCCQLPNLS